MPAVETPAKFVLPTEVSIPSKKWTEQKTLMIGPGKIGKSEFWAQGVNTFFLETEPGLQHLAVKKLPCRSWDDAREIYMLLAHAKQDGKFPYDTIVVDTIDQLIRQANEEAIMRAREKFSKIASQINAIGDIPEGVGWFWVSSMVENFLAKLTELPAHIVLIGHVQMKEIAEPTRKYNKQTINIGGQLGTKLIHWADHTLNVTGSHSGTGIRRVIRTLPSDAMEAGSRGRVVPDNFEIGTPTKESYEKFRALFD